MTASELFLRSAEVEASSVKAGQLKTFNNLRIAFKVEKTSESNANKASVKIFNLSESSRTFLENDDLKINLKVGYKNALETLFTGSIGKDGVGRTSSERAAPDWITTIEAGDGMAELTKTTINKSFSKGTPLQAVISEVASSFGFDLGSQEVFSGAVLSSIPLSGKAKDVMDTLAKRLGFEWSVQNNALQITSTKAVTPETAIVVSPDTGLISNVVKTEFGVTFKSLILPGLRPGRACLIRGSSNTNGVFKVRKAVFDGDTFEGSWQVDVEAVPL